MKPEQLDLLEGERRRDEGKAKVATHNQTWLVSARHFARRIALHRGSVTADQLRQVLYERGLFPDHTNAWGSVFKGPDWVFTGQWKKSHAPSRHANMIRVWRLKR